MLAPIEATELRGALELRAASRTGADLKVLPGGALTPTAGLRRLRS